MLDATGHVSAMTSPDHEPRDPRPRRSCCGGDAMTLVKTHPKVSSFPELRTYRCERCQRTTTVEA
ncbi:MAG: hypothetical protein JSR61_00825 [Proteobacteria bacterium]|nr:hypothetical protein [Pseudomonadota bacterium]